MLVFPNRLPVKKDMHGTMKGTFFFHLVLLLFVLCSVQLRYLSVLSYAGCYFATCPHESCCPSMSPIGRQIYTGTQCERKRVQERRKLLWGQFVHHYLRDNDEITHHPLSLSVHALLPLTPFTCWLSLSYVHLFLLTLSELWHFMVHYRSQTETRN